MVGGGWWERRGIIRRFFSNERTVCWTESRYLLGRPTNKAGGNNSNSGYENEGKEATNKKRGMGEVRENEEGGRKF